VYHSIISQPCVCGDQKRQHAEMAAVVKQRQELAVEPRQRPDAENDRQHQERAASGGTDPDVDRVGEILRRMKLPRDHDESDKEQRDCRDEDCVINHLVAVPLHRAEAGAHGLPPAAAGGSGGGRSASAIVSPSTTATASAGQIRRWAKRCERVMSGRVP
jgi:hypothetical protein